MQYVYWMVVGSWVVWWFDGTFVLGGRQTGARRGLAGLSLWFDGTSVLGGRGIGAGRDSAGCVFEFVGRMIYDTSRSESHKQSLFDRWRRQLTNQK